MRKNQLQIWKLTKPNHYQPVKEEELSAATLDQLSAMLPKSAYTTLRTYHSNYILPFAEQANRLAETMRLSGEEFDISPDDIRLGLRVAIACCGFNEARIRLSINIQLPHDIYIAVNELTLLPEQSYIDGVEVITTDSLNRENPEAKVTNFINKSQKFRKSIPENINEAIMLNGAGDLLEGMTSNFFAIMQGKLFTAGQGILNGITRKTILQLADELTIPVEYTSTNKSAIQLLDEAFITSASRGVLPVTKIDNVVIGSGKPGGITNTIMKEYDRYIEKTIEPI